MSRLQGKCVVITGASGGIGRETAIRAACEGARVVLLARSIDKLDELKRHLIEQYRTEAYAFRLDVADTTQVKRIFAEIVAVAGEIDVLINNAGFGVFKEAHEADLEETKAMFDVNVLGLIACTQMVLPSMKRRKKGHIINIASQAGKIATPKSSVYSATKHAVLGYSNSLRLESMRDHVFVTTVNPGPISTNFFNIADESGTYVKNVERFMLKPDYVADKIVSAIFTKRREINLPGWMNLGSIFYTLFPRIVETVGKNAFFKK
ncbi:SDR family oxidoreductase [Peribacillus cavernae]|uniref:SDR family oxidoreductase n=1 Tax=Peribacillus cavernae TaxID=1674310 RepID=A0A3S0TXR7_9BACI|nr:SDR family oxidoreductase [Peribacillus cavernae]MDQ0219076.1 short-subunit dehydrogenase [Peribacillus cavernae]RUQ26527.1 SDR family oxidoreductase [Peribacillus cavernae]